MLTALPHVPPTHEEAPFELVFGKRADVIERENLEENVVEKMDENIKSWESTNLSKKIF